MERSHGISIFQLFGRLANFFTTFVNPIGLNNIRWKWLIVYCCWLVFEITFVYFLFPETAGRTLEELAFCKCCSRGMARCVLEMGCVLTRCQCLRIRSLPNKRIVPWRRSCIMTMMRRIKMSLLLNDVSYRGRTLRLQQFCRYSLLREKERSRSLSDTIKRPQSLEKSLRG